MTKGQTTHSIDQNNLWVWVKVKTGVNQLNYSDPFADSSFHLIRKKYRLLEVISPFKTNSLKNIYKLVFKNTNEQNILDELAKLPWIEYTEVCPQFKVLATPNDSLADQWYFQNIQAYNAWDLAGTYQSKVAVIDDGFNINHIDLKDHIYINGGEIQGNNIDDDLNGYTDDYRGYDVGDHDTDLSPTIPTLVHGTHVAGIVAANTNNLRGVAAVSYNLAKLIPIKASNTAGVLVNVEEAIEYAILMKAEIINMSFGGYDTSNYKTLRTLLMMARDSGIILVASAGNDGIDKEVYPAAYDFVIAVGASGKNNQMSSLSQYGRFVDLVAPGDSILSTISTNKLYGYQSGTSMSSAMVSAALVLLKSLYAKVSNNLLVNCLLSQADPIESLNHPKYVGKIGSGRLNIYASMLCAKNNYIYHVDHKLNLMEIYPNPSSNELVFLASEWQGEVYTFYLVDANGRRVFDGILRDKKTTISLANLVNGVYFINIYSDDKVWNQKLILQR